MLLATTFIVGVSIGAPKPTVSFGTDRVAAAFVAGPSRNKIANTSSAGTALIRGATINSTGMGTTTTDSTGMGTTTTDSTGMGTTTTDSTGMGTTTTDSTGMGTTTTDSTGMGTTTTDSTRRHTQGVQFSGAIAGIKASSSAARGDFASATRHATGIAATGQIGPVPRIRHF